MMPSIWASPIVYNGLVYVGIAGYGKIETDSSLRGEVVALNALSGSLVWNFTTMIGTSGGAGVWGTVAIDPSLNALFIGTGNAYSKTTDTKYAYSILSLDASSGNLLWAYQVYQYKDDKDFGSSPNLFTLSQGNMIGIGGKDGNYYVLDRSTGALVSKFSISTRAGIIGVPAVLGDTSTNPEVFIPANVRSSTSAICCATVTALLPSLTAQTGAIAWSFQAQGHIDGSVTLIPSAVIFGDEAGDLYALSTSNGVQLFKVVLPAPIASGVTSAEGYILVSTGLGSVKSSASALGVYAFAPS